MSGYEKAVGTVPSVTTVMCGPLVERLDELRIRMVALLVGRENHGAAALSFLGVALRTQQPDPFGLDVHARTRDHLVAVGGYELEVRTVILSPVRDVRVL